MELEQTDLYKSASSIHMGLISEYDNSKKLAPSTLFENSEFVQRPGNNISFLSRKQEEFPTAFELQNDVIFHTCLFYPQPDNQKTVKALRYYHTTPKELHVIHAKITH